MSQSTSSTTVYKRIRSIEGLELWVVSPPIYHENRSDPEVTFISLASEPIAVIVGTSPNKKTWQLHKELLISSSPFFAAALNGSFAEATSKVIMLPEDNPNAFALFIQWLYIGETATYICTADHDHDHDHDVDYYDDDDHHCCMASVPICIQAWILGDKLGCSIFKDLAMLRLIRTFGRWVIDVDTVRTAYQVSAPGSKLRKFLLDQVRYEAKADYFSDDTDEWVLLARVCVDFGEDIMKAVLTNGDNEVKDPSEQKANYLEVLTDEDACV